MILQVIGRLVNSLIQPQFARPEFHQLVTVQFFHFEKIREFLRRLNDDLRLNVHNRYFPFAGYTDLESLRIYSKHQRRTYESLLVEKGISPAPAAYMWTGITHEKGRLLETAEIVTGMDPGAKANDCPSNRLKSRAHG